VRAVCTVIGLPKGPLVRVATRCLLSDPHHVEQTIRPHANLAGIENGTKRIVLQGGLKRQDL